MIVAKRRRAPRLQNYRTGVWSGLGAVTPPVYESCGFDAACIARNNVLEQAYLKQLYAETGTSDISDPGGVVSPRDPVTGAVLIPDSGNVQPAFGTPIGTPVAVAPMPTLVTNSANYPLAQGPLGNTEHIMPVAVTPQGQVIGTSSGAQSAPSASQATAVSTGFDFSAVPWYVWAGGAVAALFMFGGSGGR